MKLTIEQSMLISKALSYYSANHPTVSGSEILECKELGVLVRASANADRLKDAGKKPY